MKCLTLLQVSAAESERKPKLPLTKKRKLVDGECKVPLRKKHKLGDRERRSKVPLMKKRKLGDGGRKLKISRLNKPKLAVGKHAKLTPPTSVCFVCRQDGGGETVRCARGVCGKIYHLACLNLPERPQGAARFVFLLTTDCRVNKWF